MHFWKLGGSVRIAAVVAGLVEGKEVDGGCYALAFLAYSGGTIRLGGLY